MRRRLAALAAAMMLAPAAHAANLPENFKGMWIDAVAENKELCQKVEPNGALELMMNVGPEGVTYFEQYCKIVSVKRLPGPNPNGDERDNFELGLACKAEDTLWSAREIWHAQMLDGKKALVVTGLGQSNFRNDKGRPQKVRSTVMTTIYYACAR